MGPMKNCSDLFLDKPLHGLAWRHYDLFVDVSFHFNDVRRSNVVFSHYKVHGNASITVKVLGGISYHVMVEILKHLKDKLDFSSFLLFLVC